MHLDVLLPLTRPVLQLDWICKIYLFAQQIRFPGSRAFPGTILVRSTAQKLEKVRLGARVSADSDDSVLGRL